MRLHRVFLFAALALFSIDAIAVDISNPRTLMFVGDKNENLIDVVSLKNNEVIFRIETSIRPDHILATPFAPVLVYADIGAQKMVFYDLSEQQESKSIDLPLVPRHAVLDTTGSKIGVSDSVSGGFALVRPLEQRVDFSVADFPPTRQVLFDPNDVDLYYSNSATGSVGILNTNTRDAYEIALTSDADQELTAPSRSLDARTIYIGNSTTGEVYSVNAFSGAVFKTFNLDGNIARPYTTPEGIFLYMLDKDAGRLISVEQQGYSTYADATLGPGVDLVTVGRFDHLNLFLSSENKAWYIFDNIRKSVVANGEFIGTPIGALGSADGKTAFVAFSDSANIAFINLEKHDIQYATATQNGSNAFTIGLSNNVCH